MARDPFLIVVVLAALVVLGILLFGIGGFATGSEFNRKHANKVMRMRIIAQAVAVALIMIFIFRREGG
ncbi:MAG: twin transmembrane helix small protein [Rhodobacteraceae bacterium]|nr:twin transmembrane helix small protein [Paracoccaceae bacterium]